ncbi:hypothetical protein ACFL54_03810 [Planctomycetota bacterium]
MDICLGASGMFNIFKSFLVVFVLAGMVISAGCSGGQKTERNINTRKNQATETEQDVRKHPSPDREGLIYYYSNAQAKRSNQTVVSQIVLFSDGYEKEARQLIRDKQVDLFRKLTADQMGAVLFQMNEYGFFGWKQSPDYSTMGKFQDASIGQITVRSELGNKTTAWTSADTSRMTPVSKQRWQKFSNLRYIILCFCQSSDIEIQTEVKRR